MLGYNEYASVQLDPKVAIKQFARNSLRKTAEARYWDNFKKLTSEKEHGKVSSVSFSHESPFNFAVRMFNGLTCSPSKAITRFKDVVHSVSYRSDGSLIAAGGDWPIIKVFEAKTKGQIREFRGHKAAVQALSFLPGDTQEQVCCLEGHKDYVRSIAHISAEVVVSGSYDHKVAGWDLRTRKQQWSVDHGHPVEDILVLPSGSLVVTAGDRYIKIWDLTSGGRLLQTLSSHQKAVTCIAHTSTASKASRLLAGSLDQQLKFYDLETFEVTHSVRYESPILSLGVSKSEEFPVVVVGMLDGTVSIRRRQPQQDSKLAIPAPPPRTGTKRYYNRGVKYQPGERDILIMNRKKKKLQPYDVFLRKFEYNRALDAALRSGHPVVVVSVVEELMRRNALKNALGGRDDQELLPVLAFVLKHIVNPHYTRTLVETAHQIVNLYGAVCRQSPIIDDLMVKLKDQISEEIQLQESMLKIAATIELLVSNGAPS
eukprot:jgi/Bigna1/146753/aug1.120_g21461